MRYISIYLQATRARKRYLITRTKENILGILPAAALVCGVAACALGLSASGINLVQDPSFEERPPRGLDPHDHPWGVKKRDRPPVSRLCGARLQTEKQFARMQFVHGTDSECPDCNQSVSVSTNRCNSQHGLYIQLLDTRDDLFEFRGSKFHDCHNYPSPPSDPTRANLCPDDDGDEEVDLGPTPPNYEKEYVAKYDSDTPTSNGEWSLISHAFNSGPHNVLYVRYFNVYSGSDHTDIDNISVVTVPPCRSLTRR